MVGAGLIGMAVTAIGTLAINALIPVDDPVTPDVDEGSVEEVAKTLDRWVK